MSRNRIAMAVFLFVWWPALAGAQYIAVSGGGLFSKDLTGAGDAGGIVRLAQSEFSNSGALSVDAGVGLLPFIGGALHYSYSKPEVSVERGDIFGSSAVVGLTTHTLTFDGRLQTPNIVGYRLYGLMGVGFSRFQAEVKREVEQPFPSGPPDDMLAAVFTYGAGIEKSIFPFLLWKLEVRDYVTAVPEELFQPGGSWHRVLFVAGIVIGR